MSQEKIASSHFSPDTLEFILLLRKYNVRYLITGGEAVIYHGYARFTGDVDFFYDRARENATNLFRALHEFWDGNIPGVDSTEELTQEGLILQFGRPPNRIDLINRIDGVSFEEAWPVRTEAILESESGDIPVYYISLEKLIENKKAAGRPKDLDDLKYLTQALAND